MEQTEIKEQLKEDMGVAVWEDLNPFVKRGTLFHLDNKYDLLDAAYRIAIDDSSFIKELIENKKLLKMDHETFNEYTNNKFACIIVDPFVLFKIIE